MQKRCVRLCTLLHKFLQFLQSISCKKVLYLSKKSCTSKIFGCFLARFHNSLQVISAKVSCKGNLLEQDFAGIARWVLILQATFLHTQGIHGIQDNLVHRLRQNHIHANSPLQSQEIPTLAETKTKLSDINGYWAQQATVTKSIQDVIHSIRENLKSMFNKTIH